MSVVIISRLEQITQHPAHWDCCGEEPELLRIPNTVELSHLLRTHFNNHNSGITNSEIDMNVGPHLRIRICYLCLATAANHFDADSSVRLLGTLTGKKNNLNFGTDSSWLRMPSYFGNRP
ncbi:hypothetical protein VP01_843g7 [Puccinia sorghi]|uniref:Uncharacterized protein n=1 Tax=Puccinia sorghi TaxID=27349 RepID=A0A0L6U9A5_9BASI|nr:hypothetical protein VP01_843g7 [Puccinia sorghi]